MHTTQMTNRTQNPYLSVPDSYSIAKTPRYGYTITAEFSMYFLILL